MFAKLAACLATAAALAVCPAAGSQEVVFNREACENATALQSSCPAASGVLASWPESLLSNATEATCGKYEICNCPDPGQPLYLRAHFTGAGNGAVDRYLAAIGFAGPGADYLEFQYFVTAVSNSNNNEPLCRVGGETCAFGYQFGSCDSCNTDKQQLCETNALGGLSVVGSNTTNCTCQTNAFGPRPSETSNGGYYIDVAITLRDEFVGQNVDCTATVMTTISTITNEPDYLPTVDFPVCLNELAPYCPSCEDNGGGDGIDFDSCLLPLGVCLSDPTCKNEFEVATQGQTGVPDMNTFSTKMRDLFNCLVCPVHEELLLSGKCGAAEGLASWPEAGFTNLAKEISCGNQEICGCPFPGSSFNFQARIAAASGGSLDTFLHTVALAGPGAEHLEIEYTAVPAATHSDGYMCSSVAPASSGPCSAGSCTSCGTALNSTNVCSSSAAGIVATLSDTGAGESPGCLCMMSPAGAPAGSTEWILDIKVSVKAGTAVSELTNCSSTLSVVFSDESELDAECSEPLKPFCPECGGVRFDGVGKEIVFACPAEFVACSEKPTCLASLNDLVVSEEPLSLPDGAPEELINLYKCAVCKLANSCDDDGFDISKLFGPTIIETCGGLVDACVKDEVCFAQLKEVADSESEPTNPTGAPFTALVTCVTCATSNATQDLTVCNATVTDPIDPVDPVDPNNPNNQTNGTNIDTAAASALFPRFATLLMAVLAVSTFYETN